MPISLLASLSCEIYSDVRKHPLNSKPIPQIDPTNYLELFRRSCSLKIRCQTFSVVMGERNPFFPVSVPGLFAWTKNHNIISYTKRKAVDRLAREHPYLQCQNEQTGGINLNIKLKRQKAR